MMIFCILVFSNFLKMLYNKQCCISCLSGLSIKLIFTKHCFQLFLHKLNQMTVSSPLHSISFYDIVKIVFTSKKKNTNILLFSQCRTWNQLGWCMQPSVPQRIVFQPLLSVHSISPALRMLLQVIIFLQLLYNKVRSVRL